MLLSQDSICAPIKPRRLRAKVQSSSEHNADGSDAGNARRRNFLLSTLPRATRVSAIRNFPSSLPPPCPLARKMSKEPGVPLAKGTVLSSLSLSLSLSLSFSLSDSGVRRAGTLISFAPRFRHVDQKFSVIQETNSRRFAPPRATFGDKVFSRKVITGNENMRAMPGIWVAGIIITECN